MPFLLNVYGQKSLGNLPSLRKKEHFLPPLSPSPFQFLQASHPKAQEESPYRASLVRRFLKTPSSTEEEAFPKRPPPRSQTASKRERSIFFKKNPRRVRIFGFKKLSFARKASGMDAHSSAFSPLRPPPHPTHTSPPM